MATGAGDLESALRGLLPANILEVEGEMLGLA
jgi:hypothetical protein